MQHEKKSFSYAIDRHRYLFPALLDTEKFLKKSQFSFLPVSTASDQNILLLINSLSSGSGPDSTKLSGQNTKDDYLAGFEKGQRTRQTGYPKTRPFIVSGKPRAERQWH